MNHWLSLTGSFGVATLLACSSTPAPPFPNVNDFCAAKAKAECQVAATCAVDTTQCPVVRAQVCAAGAAVATGSGTRQYFQPNAQACIDKVQQAYSNQSKVTAADLVTIDDLCSRVFQGTADKNQPCASDYDCTSSRICAPVTAGSTSKVCADPLKKSAADFCADPGSQCAAGSYCAATTGAPQCKARPAMGEVCSSAIPCVETLRCVGSVCAPRQNPGQLCASNDDCGTQAPFCDPNGGNVCTVGLTFAGGAFDCRAFQADAPHVTPDAGGLGDAASGG